MTAAPYQVMPDHSPDDFAALEASILEHGVRVAVEYDEAGNILDGHTRVVICEKYGLAEWPKIIRSGLSEADKRAHARALNCARRQLTRDQKAALIDDQLRDEPSISDRALAAMMSVDHKTVGSRRARLVAGGEIPHQPKRRGRDGVVQPVKTMFVPEAANQKAYLHGAKVIRTARMSHSRDVKLDLHAAITADAPRGDAAALPVGQYPVVYCDPPWKNHVRSEATGNDKAYPYPSMDDDAIVNLCAGAASPATADAVLFLWVTANRVALGIDVLRAWGFEYKSQIVWDKVNQGTGRWVFDRHELLLIATRGKALPAPMPGTQPPSVYAEAKGAHSVKPVWFAELIQKMYPGVAKLEMFQRAASLTPDDVRRNGEWAFWGNEASLQGADAPSLPAKVPDGQSAFEGDKSSQERDRASATSRRSLQPAGDQPSKARQS